MKNYTKKGILQKIILIIAVVIAIYNTMFIPIANAESVYGSLFSPVQALLVGLGDGLMWIANCASGNWEAPVRETNVMYFQDGFVDPNFTVTPGKIFSNQVPLLSANIINPPQLSGSIVGTMQSTVSGWYQAFRNFAIVALLSVLVYTAIRIIISSTAADKSKYKTMLKDWLVAFCLLFFMHYIMSFATTMIESITTALTKEEEISYESGEIYAEVVKEHPALNYIEVRVGEKTYNLNYDYNKDLITSDGKIKISGSFYTNDLMEYIRIKCWDNGGEFGEEFAYTVLYLVMVIYTLMFLFVYIKRVIYIIFLTMLAPLVAISYPLDKMRDGSAQGFNTWLREYIFNLLIQPLHLLLYYVLVTSAMELATQYVIYPIVVIGFMLPAEKILRKLFGFDKASTANSLLSGAMGGAVAMKGIDYLGRKLRGGVKGAVNNNKQNSDKPDKINTRAMDKEYKNMKPEDYLGEEAGISDGEVRESLNNSEYNNPDEFATGTADNNFDEFAAGTNTNNTFEQRGINADGFDFGEPNENGREWWENISFPAGSADTEELKPIEGSYEDYIMKLQEGDAKKAKKPLSREKWENKEMAKSLALSRKEGRRAVAKKYFLNKDKNMADLKKWGGRLVKGVGGLYGAATLGTAGIAAGLASDSYKNVLTYGAAAGAIGAGAGSRLANKAIKLPSGAYRKANEVQDVYLQGSMSKEAYQNFINNRLDAQFKRDTNEIEKFKKAFKDEPKISVTDKKGKTHMVDAYKVAMDKAIKYREAGVTDSDIIIKAMKAKSQYASSEWDDKRRIYAAKLSPFGTNEKGIEDIGKRLRNQGVRNEKQIKDQQEMIRQITGQDY